MSPFRSLRIIVSVFVLAAFLLGGLAVWLWTHSQSDWRTYQDTAYVAGIKTYNTLQNNAAAPTGIHIRTLNDTDAQFAKTGAYRQITGAPTAARITNIPISPDPTASSTPLHVIILSSDLTYPLANLPFQTGQTAADTTGEVFRLLVTYCSNPFVIAKMGDAQWVQIDAASIWDCNVSPRDYRLFAVILATIAIGGLITAALNLSSEFSTFAQQLRNRRRVGGPSSYSSDGPEELQDIVSAVNAYLETERDQLKSRAAVLSGVSHDLGTPATRLRLRAALINDAQLRHKFEADIDSMTNIIESVLTYTRAEMNIEKPKKLSLTALIDSIVTDYQDTGRSVTLRPVKDVVLQGGRSVFMSRQGQSLISRDQHLTIIGRPISLERAITNLIDNALKYGRRATIALELDANTATIIVEDEGSDNSAKDIEALMAPFKRGEDTTTIDGHGLGLTIVATIAQLHGGSLSFEDTAVGVSAHLRIQRR